MKKFIPCFLSIFFFAIALLIPNTQAQAATLVFHKEYISGYSANDYKKAEKYLTNKFEKDGYDGNYCGYRDGINSTIKKSNFSSSDKKILTYDYYAYHSFAVVNLTLHVRQDYSDGKINSDTYIKSMKLLNSYFRYNIESGKDKTLKTCPSKVYNAYETILSYGRNYTKFAMQSSNLKTDPYSYLEKNSTVKWATVVRDYNVIIKIAKNYKATTYGYLN